MSTGSVLQNESNQEKTLLEKEQRVWTMTKKKKKKLLIAENKGSKGNINCKKQGRKSTFQELQGNSNGLYVRIKAICKLSTAY